MPIHERAVGILLRRLGKEDAVGVEAELFLVVAKVEPIDADALADARAAGKIHLACLDGELPVDSTGPGRPPCKHS